MQDLIAGRGKPDSVLWLPCEPTERTTARRFNAFKCKPRAHAPLEEEETDDDSLGYEDDFSSGIDLPMTLDVTSGAYKKCQEILFWYAQNTICWKVE